MKSKVYNEKIIYKKNRNKDDKIYRFVKEQKRIEDIYEYEMFDA